MNRGNMHCYEHDAPHPCRRCNLRELRAGHQEWLALRKRERAGYLVMWFGIGMSLMCVAILAVLTLTPGV